jgi:hypothetical protein
VIERLKNAISGAKNTTQVLTIEECSKEQVGNFCVIICSDLENLQGRAGQNDM